MSVIVAHCSKVFRSSFIKAVEINHEAHEGHEEFAGVCSERLSHNCNLAVVALVPISSEQVKLAHESCGAFSSRK